MLRRSAVFKWHTSPLARIVNKQEQFAQIEYRIPCITKGFALFYTYRICVQPPDRILFISPRRMPLRHCINRSCLPATPAHHRLNASPSCPPPLHSSRTPLYAMVVSLPPYTCPHQAHPIARSRIDTTYRMNFSSSPLLAWIGGPCAFDALFPPIDTAATKPVMPSVAIAS